MSKGAFFHHTKGLAASGKCEGGCTEHTGTVKVCRVATRSGNDWGYWSYCANARNEDRSRGLVVREVPEPNAGQSLFPFAPDTERFWEAPEGWPEAVYNGDRALEALTRIMYDGVNKPSPELVLMALECGQIPGFVDRSTIMEHHRTL